VVNFRGEEGKNDRSGFNLPAARVVRTLERIAAQRDSSAYMCFKAPVFFFQFPQAFDVSRFHATVFCFPFVVTRIADLVLATNVLHRSCGFDGLQDGDDLVLTESGNAQHNWGLCE
jgi:hypothetical protein